jgi:ABC-type transport system involved in multi-copper enzyme maturation permease subunit
MVKYEILWNIRKKKFLGMLIVAFALVTLSLAGGYIRSSITGQPMKPNPDFVINSNLGLGGIGFFLFAVVTVMNTISGEFDSGTIVPLLAKPISRTTVFIGKIFAAFLTLLATYTFLMIYLTIGGYVVYGPQNNLHLVPLSLIGSMLSTLVWIAIVLAIGSIFKSSILAAIVPFGIWLGSGILSGILGTLMGQGWILTYVPGSGNSGFVKGVDSSPPYLGIGISTGTDSIGPNLINYVLHPSWEVTFYKLSFGQLTDGFSLEELYSMPLSLVLLQSIAVALTYFVVFTVIAWYTFKRAQITE